MQKRRSTMRSRSMHISFDVNDESQRSGPRWLILMSGRRFRRHFRRLRATRHAPNRILKRIRTTRGLDVISATPIPRRPSPSARASGCCSLVRYGRHWHLLPKLWPRTGTTVANRTLWTGWWGVLSFFTNIGFVFSNAGALLKHGQLRASCRRQGLPRSRPIPSVSQRDAAACSGRGNRSNLSRELEQERSGIVRAVVRLILRFVLPFGRLVRRFGSLVVRLVLRFVLRTGYDRGRCDLGDRRGVERVGLQVHPTACGGVTDGTVVDAVATSDECPVTTDGYVEYGGLVYCIDTY